MSQPDAMAARQRHYSELLQQIGGSLLNVAPEGWRRIDLIAKLAEGAQDLGLTVIMSDYSDAWIEPPRHLTSTFVALRKVMYDEQRGAWLSARYTIDPPSAFQIFYNYDHDPLWEPPLPTAMLRRDLEVYPRPSDRVPRWLSHATEQADASHAG